MSPPPPTARRPGLSAAFGSWRVGALALLSLSSGLPLGLVLTAVPTWMAREGVDIKTIGLLTLAQAPYAFKFLWAPAMDRYWPHLLGRKRGWILVAQGALAVATGLLATQAASPDVGAVALLTLAVAFASASQDIAVDGYAVEVLEPQEHGLAVGARTAMYRAGMLLSGRLAVSVAPLLGWRWTMLALSGACLALVPVTLFAPEPLVPAKPAQTLRAALWEPIVGFLARPRALEIAAFVVLYRLGDNLAVALVTPFLVERGYSDFDIGIGTGVVVMSCAVGGTFVGGALTSRWGLGRALWIFGVVQAVATLAYAALAVAPVYRPLLYAAVAIEAATTGLGSGAFSVLLLRLTEKRFSATQYALLSSLFALARTVSGPPAGALAWAIGWANFFVLTVFAAVPGLVVLHRFARWNQPQALDSTAEAQQVIPPGEPWPRRTLALVAGASTIAGTAVGVLASSTLAALKHVREGRGFDLRPMLEAVLRPPNLAGAMSLLGSVAFGGLVGMAIAAGMAARGRRLR